MGNSKHSNYKNKNTETKYFKQYGQDTIFKGKKKPFRVKKRFCRIKR